MPSEQYIENNVIRNRVQLGYKDSLFIRRCRTGRGFGIVDTLILPTRGPHRAVLIEAKLAHTQDASGKVIGQLILYYAGLMQIGEQGFRMLRKFARTYPSLARSTKPKLLKSLSGGISPPDKAWTEFQKGPKLQPHQVAMYVAINGEARPSLKSALEILNREHGLNIGIVSVHKKDSLSIWIPE